MDAVLLLVLAIFGVVFWQDTDPQKKKEKKEKKPEDKLVEALAAYEKHEGKKTKIVVEISDK